MAASGKPLQSEADLVGSVWLTDTVTILLKLPESKLWPVMATDLDSPCRVAKVVFIKRELGLEMRNWDQIVCEHGPTAFRQVQRILGPGPDVDDVVQEVFLETFRLWEERPVRNWSGLLCRIATNRAIDLLRRRRILQPLTDVDVPDTDDGPLEYAIVGELADRLRVSIGCLPDQQAAVFSLRYFADQSHEQIAEALDIKVSAVGTALHKARMKLDSLLDVSAKGAS